MTECEAGEMKEVLSGRGMRIDDLGEGGKRDVWDSTGFII